ncbi:MAG: hypothetical protein JNN28_18995 [Saprospiraceae bacterium]|nr:hypothetical protein [Saprospiraceae bacterium]
MNKPTNFNLKFAFFLLCLTAVTRVSGQQDCLETYDQEAIYLRAELFSGSVYVKNGKSHSIGFAYRRLRPEFDRTPRALPVFKKSQRFAKAQFWVGIAGMIGTGIGAAMVLQSVNHQGYLSDEKQFTNGLNLMLGSLTVSTAICLPLQIKSRQQLEDAIWLRNRELFER